MRIVHAHKYFYLRAGAERYMLDLMKMQEEAGDFAAPFAMHYPKNIPTPWSKFFVSELDTENGVGRGINAFKQFKRAWWSCEAEKKMIAMIEEFRPDACHAHNIYFHLSPSILKACNKKDVPVVMSVHDYNLISANYSLWDKGTPMNLKHLGIFDTASTRFIKGSYAATLTLSMIQKWHRFRRAYDRYVHRYIVPSNFVKDVLVKNGYSENKVIIAPLFSRHGCIKGRFEEEGYVLYVGRLDATKGVDTLIESMQSLPDAKLKIAGTGPFESQLRKQASGLRNIEWLGFVSGDALWEIIQKARVIVVPSLWYEVYGLGVIEAMGCGKPVIVSDRGSLPEIVEDGISGRIFHAGDHEDLTRILKEFIHDKKYAESLGEAACGRGSELMTPERYLKFIRAIYTNAIKSKK